MEVFHNRALSIWVERIRLWKLYPAERRQVRYREGTRSLDCTEVEFCALLIFSTGCRLLEGKWWLEQLRTWHLFLLLLVCWIALEFRLYICWIEAEFGWVWLNFTLFSKDELWCLSISWITAEGWAILLLKARVVGTRTTCISTLHLRYKLILFLFYLPNLLRVLSVVWKDFFEVVEPFRIGF